MARAAEPRPDVPVVSVELAGPQTIRVIDGAHAQLRDALAAHAAVEIDCTGLTEADISLVQLLLAARRSAEAAGRKLTFKAPAPGVLVDVLSRGGFIEGPHALASADGGFWLKGTSGP